MNVVNERRNDTYVRLAKIGAEVGVDEGAMLKLLKVSDQPDKDGALNVGNGVTNDLKVMVKVRFALAHFSIFICIYICIYTMYLIGDGC